MKNAYLDNAATTRTLPEVAQLAAELMCGDFGNPSSLHTCGLAAQKRLAAARAQIADALGCEPEELVFTSGGTEANNLALLGAFAAQRRRGNTVVVSGGEHASVLEPLRRLEQRGEILLRTVPLCPDGHADSDALIEAVDGDTILLCCMLVNSEVGAVAPIAGIAKAARRKNSRLFVHCDAVQAFGKIAFSPRSLGVDLLSVSGHKLHAPKGCGALFVKKGVRILPIMHGGGQERGLRPGTENVPLCCAFAAAAQLAKQNCADNFQKISGLFEYFIKKTKAISGLCINSPADGAPYICNISIPGYRSEIMLHYLAQRGVSVSSGSACSGGRASHVLSSMGLPPARIDSALRVSFCAHNTAGDVDAFFEALAAGMEQIARSARA